jgi:hypothetical protein
MQNYFIEGVFPEGDLLLDLKRRGLAAAPELAVADGALGFYDFPAEHWKHLRTSNPIESTFATVRHRTIRSKGCLSNKTALALVFKLIEGARKSWRRLDGHNLLPKLIQGVKFTDGIEAVRQDAQTTAA